MYRLLIIAEEDGERTMLSICGTRDSFSKDLVDFFQNAKNLNWQHSETENAAMALFKGLLEKAKRNKEEAK